jgi:hypothetical protein
MNRGKYDFPDEGERLAWERMVGLAIDRMLPEDYPDDWDVTSFDISPWLLGRCVEAHGWCWWYNTLEREDSWSYYTHSDHPNKLLSIYADSNTFKCTLCVYNREEE